MKNPDKYLNQCPTCSAEYGHPTKRSANAQYNLWEATMKAHAARLNGRKISAAKAKASAANGAKGGRPKTPPVVGALNEAVRAIAANRPTLAIECINRALAVGFDWSGNVSRLEAARRELAGAGTLKDSAAMQLVRDTLASVKEGR